MATFFPFYILSLNFMILFRAKGSVMIIMMVTLCHPRAKTIFMASRVKAKLHRRKTLVAKSQNLGVLGLMVVSVTKYVIMSIHFQYQEIAILPRDSAWVDHAEWFFITKAYMISCVCNIFSISSKFWGNFGIGRKFEILFQTQNKSI